jgi:hypothetical protein
MDAAAAIGIALFAGAIAKVRRIDAAMVEQTALDVLVGRHNGIDVLQVVEARAVRNLVQRAQGDHRGVGICGHIHLKGSE